MVPLQKNKNINISHIQLLQSFFEVLLKYLAILDKIRKVISNVMYKIYNMW
jgi:hypothetical protein